MKPSCASEPTVRYLRSPWQTDFSALLATVRQSLLLCAPFVSQEPCRMVADAIQHTRRNETVNVELITDLSRDNLLSGATDARAIYGLAKSLPGFTVRFLPGLHAKVYIADEAKAIVTSGNLTLGGLSRNFEYGLAVNDASHVRQIRSDIQAYGAQGAVVPLERLAILADVAEELSVLQQQLIRSQRRVLRDAYESRVAIAEEEIFRARVADRPMHAVFVDAVRYILANGPATTKQIHDLIQQLHPDLCDNSVDRVIDGRHYGKKWKHAVRTAQQHLRKRGEVTLENGKWSLIR